MLFNETYNRVHRFVRITRHGTHNAVQSMFIILGHRHRLLHVRALLAKWNRGEKEIFSMQSDWHTYSRHDFQNSLALLQLDRLQLTAVYYYRREVSTPHLKCENRFERWLRETSKMNYSITAVRIGTTRTTSKTESTTM